MKAIVLASVLALGILWRREEHSKSNAEPSKEIAMLAALPCKFARSIPLEYFNLSPSRVPRSSAMFCGRAELGTVVAESLFHIGPHGEYRFSYFKPRTASPEEFVVYLTGGPRETVTGPAEAFTKSTIYGIVEVSGAGVIAPDYLGTRLRSRYPSSDLQPAGMEIASLILDIHEAHPNAQISLVGQSIGALVAVEVLKHIQVPTVLVSPPLASIQYLVQPGNSDLNVDAAFNPARFARTRTVTGDFEWVTTTQGDQIKAFMGPDFKTSLSESLQRLPEGRRECLALVVGRLDRRIGLAKLPEVRSVLGSRRVTVLPYMQHRALTAKDATKLGAVIRDVTPKVCS